MKTQLHYAGFTIRSVRAVSTFRLGALKRLFGAKRLAATDGALQRPLASLAISPSMFVLNQRSPLFIPLFARGGQGGALFACPTCRLPLPAEPVDDELVCTNGHRWSTRDGVYDFKMPLEQRSMKRGRPLTSLRYAQDAPALRSRRSGWRLCAQTPHVGVLAPRLKCALRIDRGLKNWLVVSQIFRAGEGAGREWADRRARMSAWP